MQRTDCFDRPRDIGPRSADLGPAQPARTPRGDWADGVAQTPRVSKPATGRRGDRQDPGGRLQHTMEAHAYSVLDSYIYASQRRK